MVNFKGFSTIDKNKKFTLTDRDLIKRDLLNAFHTVAGSMPGRPEVGTRIWSYVFDPNDTQTTSAVKTEIRRIIEQDTRIELHEIVLTTAVNTIRAHVSISLLPNASVEDFYLTFVQDTQTATIT